MNRVIHFEIQADNVERAKNFYEKTLGWKIKQMMKKEEGGMDYWGITTGQVGTSGINGGLYQRPADGEKFYVYDCTIEVPDISKAMESVKVNGGMITKEKMEIPHVGWFARVKDKDNRFGLMQPTEWKPK